MIPKRLKTLCILIWLAAMHLAAADALAPIREWMSGEVLIRNAVVVREELHADNKYTNTQSREFGVQGDTFYVQKFRGDIRTNAPTEIFKGMSRTHLWSITTNTAKFARRRSANWHAGFSSTNDLESVMLREVDHLTELFSFGTRAQLGSVRWQSNTFTATYMVEGISGMDFFQLRGELLVTSSNTPSGFRCVVGGTTPMPITVDFGEMRDDGIPSVFTFRYGAEAVKKRLTIVQLTRGVDQTLPQDGYVPAMFLSDRGSNDVVFAYTNAQEYALYANGLSESNAPVTFQSPAPAKSGRLRTAMSILLRLFVIVALAVPYLRSRFGSERRSPKDKAADDPSETRPPRDGGG